VALIAVAASFVVGTNVPSSVDHGFVLDESLKSLAVLVAATLNSELQVRLFTKAVNVLLNPIAARDMVLCHLFGFEGANIDKVLKDILPGIERLRKHLAHIVEKDMPEPCDYYAMALRWGPRPISEEGPKFIPGNEVELAKYYGLWALNLMTEISELGKKFRNLEEAYPEVKEIIENRTALGPSVAHTVRADLLKFLRSHSDFGSYLKNLRQIYSFERAIRPNQVFFQAWLSGPRELERARFYLLNFPRLSLRGTLAEMFDCFYGRGTTVGDDSNDTIEFATFSQCIYALSMYNLRIDNYQGNLENIPRSWRSVTFTEDRMVLFRRFSKKTREAFLRGPPAFYSPLYSLDEIFDLALKHDFIAHLFESFHFSGDVLLESLPYLKTMITKETAISEIHFKFLLEIWVSRDFVKCLEDIKNHHGELDSVSFDSYLARHSNEPLSSHFVHSLLRVLQKAVSQEMFDMLMASDLRCADLQGCMNVVLETVAKIENCLRMRMEELDALIEHRTAAQIQTERGNRNVFNISEQRKTFEDAVKLLLIERHAIRRILCNASP